MKLPRLFSSLAIAGALLASTPARSDAAITIVQQGASTTWDFIFSPITFTANANAGQMDWLVFEDFFAAPSSNPNGTAPGQTIDISINGAPAVNYPLNNANGTFSSTLGGIDSNDLLINFAATSIDPAAGDTITVSLPVGGTTFTKGLPAPPPITAAPTIGVAIWSNNQSQGRLIQTDVVQVAVGIPEPSAFALFGLGGLALLLRRKR